MDNTTLFSKLIPSGAVRHLLASPLMRAMTDCVLLTEAPSLEKSLTCPQERVHSLS